MDVNAEESKSTVCEDKDDTMKLRYTTLCQGPQLEEIEQTMMKASAEPTFEAPLINEDAAMKLQDMILVPGIRLEWERATASAEPAFEAPLISEETLLEKSPVMDNTQRCRRVRYLFDRCLGLLDIPLVLVFGIVLYLLDVGSDVMAALNHFQKGNPVWGLLTITFVVLPALCWAAVSWTWWYNLEELKRMRKWRADREIYRRVRLWLAVLLLDPLTRQIRVLWFTLRREYCKCRVGCSDSDNISRRETEKRERDTSCWEHWDRKLNEEETFATFLSAISTLVEDAPEIILVIYIIISGVEQEILDYVQLTTSLLSIFYTTATFPRQVRLLKPEETQIKICSMATVALIVWRTLIVGSRILAFVLFASLFHYWLFVVIGFHYSFMFALVFYQMRLAQHKLHKRVAYNVVTPFVYIFDFCINWLEGPTRYWYVMVYASIYCENILMSVLGLLYASTLPSPAWYIVPCFVSVIVMFPAGIFVQVAYYRSWHPKAPIAFKPNSLENNEPTRVTQSTCFQCMTWSEFENKIKQANQTTGVDG